MLLAGLREFGADNAVTALLARHPAAHVSLDSSHGIALLLEELHSAGADEAERKPAELAANAGMFGFLLDNSPQEAVVYRFGREPDGTASQPWRWQEPVQ